MKQTSGEIISNKKYGENLFKMEIFSPFICKNSLPGQFINIKCSYDGILDPLLRRPFSIYETDKRFNVFSILYLVKGKGTGFLTKLKKGEIVDFVGPLGEGIKISKDMDNILLVAGGIGVAPLCLLAKSLVEEGRNTFFLAGFKDNIFFSWERDLAKIIRNYKIFTEDGSFGEKGIPTDFIRENVKEFLSYKLICCGPKEMLKSLQNIIIQYNISAMAVMEEIIACGIGVCMGCVIKIKTGDNLCYKRICKDGPVFNLAEVVFD